MDCEDVRKRILPFQKVEIAAPLEVVTELLPRDSFCLAEKIFAAPNFKVLQK